MRFVVPVTSAHARPNKKHFGPKHGITWSPHHSDASRPVSIQVGSLIFGVSGVMGGLRDVMILRCVRVGGAVA
jgi:hypothetical protein